LFIIVNDQQMVYDVLAALMEVGITTATVIESQGMGKIVAEQMPIFAGFRNLWGGSGSYNSTIFTVLTDEKLEETVALVREVMFDGPDKPRGVCFVMPVTHFFAPNRDT
jgi:nitrogen regulatory protein P-II 1